MSEGHLKSFMIKGGCEIKPNINYYYQKKIV